MKLGWLEEEMMKWLPTKLCGWVLNAVSHLPRGYWRSTLEKQAWTLTETLYQFDIRLSDNPLFVSQITISFLEGKREIGRNLVNPVILQIRERDSSVLKGR